MSKIDQVKCKICLQWVNLSEKQNNLVASKHNNLQGKYCKGSLTTPLEYQK